MTLPQILMGAYNSNNIGWERKTYLALRHNALISDSRSLAYFEVLSVSLLMILSISISSGLSIRDFDLNILIKIDNVI